MLIKMARNDEFYNQNVKIKWSPKNAKTSLVSKKSTGSKNKGKKDKKKKRKTSTKPSVLLK